MRTVLKKLIKVKRITVDCVQNDSVDIRCGGPAMLGFDFFIDADENPEDYVEHIKKKLKEHNVPCLYVDVSRGETEVLQSSVWSKRRISQCINRNAPGMR
jgi:hypothetical protein